MRKSHKNKKCLCASCRARRHEYAGKNNPRWKGGWKNNLPKCRECGKSVSKEETKFCKTCWDRLRHKKAKTLKKYYCIDCKIKIISYSNWKYGKKRCKSCAHKGILNPFYHSNNLNGNKNPMYGKHHSKKTIGLIINSLLGKKDTIKTKLLKSKARLGKKNPNWNGGLNKLGYSHKFNNKLKDSIRKRDNYICQKCRIKEKNHFRGKKHEKLHIHHIDYCKSNCNQSNLISLCHKCNVKANTNRDYWYAYFRYIIENKWIK